MEFRPGLALAVLAAALASCTSGVSRVRKARLDRPNPTSWRFEMPVEEARSRMIEALSRDRQWDDRIFAFAEDPAADDDAPSWREVLEVETAEDPLYRKSLFEPAGNERDLHLYSSAEPIWPSPVYLGDRGGLPFSASFHVHLATVEGGATEVSVAAIECRILNGKRWGIGPCGPGYGWRWEDVEPTTVEEYVVLRYLARALGREDLPEVALPR